MISVNSPWSKQFGWSEDELLDKDVFSFFDLEDRELARRHLQQLQINLLPNTTFRARFRHKTLDPVWMEWTAWIKPSEKKLFFSGRDISAEIHSVDLQRAERSFLESVLDNIPDMVFVKEAKDLRFVRMNKAGLKLLGVDSKDLIGKNDYDFFPKKQADFFTRVDHQVFQSKDGVHVAEEPIETPRGTRYLNTRKIAIFNERKEPKYLLGISTDITEHREHERELKEHEAALAQASKLASLGEMAGGVAHEINNPLAVISGKCRTLKRLLMSHSSEDSKAALSSVEKINEMSERIEKIVSGLLLFSRDAVRDELQQIAVNDILDITRSLAFERFHRLQVQIKFPENLPEAIRITGSATQISQVLFNLISNAVHAVEGCDQKMVALEVAADERHVTFRVSDSGPGVPREVVDKIFQPFFTTKPVGKGTGLGLSVSAGIAKRHNGKLYLDKKAPRTTFILEIPRAKIAAKAA